MNTYKTAKEVYPTFLDIFEECFIEFYMKDTYKVSFDDCILRNEECMPYLKWIFGVLEKYKYLVKSRPLFHVHVDPVSAVSFNLDIEFGNVDRFSLSLGLSNINSLELMKPHLEVCYAVITEEEAAEYWNPWVMAEAEVYNGIIYDAYNFACETCPEVYMHYRPDQHDRELLRPHYERMRREYEHELERTQRARMEG